MTKNITLSVDAGMLEAVRRYASANRTSVNAIVRETFASIAAREAKANEAWDELFRLADKDAAKSGGKRWTRDELHDR